MSCGWGSTANYEHAIISFPEYSGKIRTKTPETNFSTFRQSRIPPYESLHIAPV